MTAEQNVARLAAERATIHVCADCGGRAHCYDRCPADRRRKWTRVVPVEYVRADVHEKALTALRTAEAHLTGGANPSLRFYRAKRVIRDCLADLDDA